MKNVISKILILFLLIILATSFSYAEIISVPQTNIQDKNIISPKKILLVKLNPLITDSDKFINAVDMLFTDLLKLKQNIFSYIAVGDKIYKFRDLDISYGSNKNNSDIVYIGYTQNPPLQLLANLENAYDISSLSYAKIDFNKNVFNLTEIKGDELKLPVADNKIIIDSPQPQYEKNPDPGSLQTITVKFTNKSDYPIFKSDPSKVITITMSNGKEVNSPLYVNDQWYSKSRAGSIQEDRVGPGETGTILFSAVVGVDPGNQTQSFVLASPDGKIFTSTNFDITFTIPNKGQKIVQVKETGYGFASIREEMKSNARLIGFGYTGTKYIVLDDQGSWIKIKFDGNKEGWIPAGYLKKLY